MQMPPSFDFNSRISLGEIAAHLSDARKDKKEATRNDLSYTAANTITAANTMFLLPMGD